jgi:hypothetical protein
MFVVYPTVTPKGSDPTQAIGIHPRKRATRIDGSPSFAFLLLFSFSFVVAAGLAYLMLPFRVGGGATPSSKYNEQLEEKTRL